MTNKFLSFLTHSTIIYFKMKSIFPWMDLARELILLPYAILPLYFGLILWGMWDMQYRNAFEIKTLFSIWNLILAAFSLRGFLETAPLAFDTWLYPTCELVFHTGPPAFWVTLFMLSKVVELFDTAFLVLMKKPVSFLHVFHHSTVLIYSWTAYAFESRIGLFFTAMNYGVHALMYIYYYFSTFQKQTWGKWVTRVQILQMVAGLSVSYDAFFTKCENISNIWGSLALYTCYLILFIHFSCKKT